METTEPDVVFKKYFVLTVQLPVSDKLSHELMAAFSNIQLGDPEQSQNVFQQIIPKIPFQSGAFRFSIELTEKAEVDMGVDSIDK